jgi:hypothetical protein
MECVFYNDCRVKKKPICFGTYTRCSTYKRRKILSKGRESNKNGLDNFLTRYPEWNDYFNGKDR